MILPNCHDAAGATPPSAEQLALTALVVRSQGGDLAAQSELVRLYLRRIGGHVRGIVRHPDVVDDITQTVFIKMVRRLPYLRDPALFECWLFTLSRNSALDHLRRCRRRPVTVAAEDALAEFADPGNPGASREIRAELELALEELGTIDRELITGYIDGHSYEAMAGRSGLTTGAVKARLHRVRPFLRARLGGAGRSARPAALRAAA